MMDIEASGFPGPRGLTGAPGTAEAASALNLVPTGAGAMTVTYDLSGLDGTSAAAMSLGQFLTVLVGQNAGDPDFPDNPVVGFGYNVGPNGARSDLTMAALTDRWERSFLSGGKMAFERHIQLDTIAGVQIRPLSIFGPHDGDGVGVSSQADYVSFEQNGGARQILFDLASGFTEYSDGQALRFAGNDDAVLQQQNAAASAYLSLLRVNARNEQETVLPTYLVADPVTNVFAVSAHVTRNLTNPVNGGFGEYAIAGDVVGDYTMCFRQVSVSGALLDQLVNPHATGRIVRSLVTAGGDAMEVCQVGAAFAGFGHHASSGELRFGFYNDLVNNIALRLAKPADGYLATFSGPVKHAPFTVATLPTPTSALTGANVWASDARNDGEGAAAGTGSTVECNGSIWKIPGVAAAVAA